MLRFLDEDVTLQAHQVFSHRGNTPESVGTPVMQRAAMIDAPQILPVLPLLTR